MKRHSVKRKRVVDEVPGLPVSCDELLRAGKQYSRSREIAQLHQALILQNHAATGHPENGGKTVPQQLQQRRSKNIVSKLWDLRKRCG